MALPWVASGTGRRHACALSGRLKARARPFERTWARVFREGGGGVREHVSLKDTVVPEIDPQDGGCAKRPWDFRAPLLF